MCHLKILTTPKPQARHRSSSRNGRTFQYDPSQKDKSNFAKQVTKALESMDKTPFNEDISVSLTFAMPRPKGHFRTGKYAGKLKPKAPVYVTARPDIDNLIKFVFDACNKILWVDDCCIVEVQARKIYTAAGEKPFTEMEIWEVKDQ